MPPPGGLLDRAAAGSPLLGRGAVLLLAAALAILPLNDRSLYEPDEGRYADVARTMVLTGNWLVPYFEGELHLSKPPFAYWASAAGQVIFGSTTFGARFFPAMAWLVSVALVMGLARRWVGVPASTLAGAIYATIPMSFGAGQFLSADGCLAFWQILGVWAAVEAWSRGPGARRYVLTFWFAFGMAFFTKGPPGLLGLVPVVIGAWLRRRARQPRVLWSPVGFLLMVGLSLWWFLYIVFRDTGKMGYFLDNEVYRRIFTAFHRRDNTRFIYLLAFTGGILPWIGGYGPLAVRLRDWWRADDRRIVPGMLLPVAWILVSITVFCLARSRLILYVTPLMAPLAVLLGAAFVPWAARHTPRARWILVGVAAILSVTANHYCGHFFGQGGSVRAVAGAITNVAGQVEPLVIQGSGRTMASLGFYVGLRSLPPKVERGNLATDPEAALAKAGVTRESTQPAFVITRADQKFPAGTVLSGLVPIFRDQRYAVYRFSPAAMSRPTR